MPWPSLQDYNEAIQNPRQAFADPDLKLGQPELNTLGLPRPISGNFACVYKIQLGGQLWAARIFSNEISDHQRRYEAISNYLKKAELPYTVEFSFLPAGIKVLGRNYPLLKMEWVQGESLSKFIGKSIGYSDTLLSLAKVWSKMMSDLKAVSIAHGDLQHGNVVVVGDQLRLIDYDGMFVPTLAGCRSNECGHRNYQLPSRTGLHYGPYLDNFSAWVIYVSLVSLAVHPELWNKHRGGDECLIFRKEDFQQPENSELLRNLNLSPNAELRFLVELFTSFFSLSPEDVPALDGNLQTPIIDKPKPRDWWIDHTVTPRSTEEILTESQQPKNEEQSVPDPGWILDSLMEEKPIEKLKFTGRIGGNRIIFLGSMALVALTRFLVEIPTSELFVIVTYVFGLNILLCYVNYKRDPSLAEFDVFKKESAVFLKQVREHQSIVDSISAERSVVEAKLAENENAIRSQKGRLNAALQNEIASLQLELNAQLAVITQRRRDNLASETNKLSSLQNTLGNQIAELDRKILGLNQKEIDEKTRASRLLQDAHVERFLKSCSIQNSNIAGIGGAYKSRLINRGFYSAADISSRVRSVQGIGYTRGAALVAWRQSMEYLAKRGAPSLSFADSAAIENRYSQERQRLVAEKQQHLINLNSQLTSVRDYFAGLKQPLNNEEQQIRTASNQKRAQTQKRYDEEIALQDKQMVAAKNQATPTINQLSEQIRETQKKTFALKWQAAKREKEGRRFAALRFSNYLRTIIEL